MPCIKMDKPLVNYIFRQSYKMMPITMLVIYGKNLDIIMPKTQGLISLGSTLKIINENHQGSYRQVCVKFNDF